MKTPGGVQQIRDPLLRLPEGEPPGFQTSQIDGIVARLPARTR
jgi:hypothetical protein